MNSVAGYSEFFIDPVLNRPWTFFEERFMNKFLQEKRIFDVDYIYSFRLHMFWPKWLVRFAARNLVKCGHLYESYGLYELMPQGKNVLEQKKAYEGK